MKKSASNEPTRAARRAPGRALSRNDGGRARRGANTLGAYRRDLEAYDGFWHAGPGPRRRRARSISGTIWRHSKPQGMARDHGRRASSRRSGSSTVPAWRGDRRRQSGDGDRKPDAPARPLPQAHRSEAGVAAARWRPERAHAKAEGKAAVQGAAAALPARTPLCDRACGFRNSSG